MNPLITHLKHLISCPSISPHDAGCQNYLATFLESLGFRCQFFPKNKVINLYAEYGHSGPLLVFAGHTDVVEPGPLSAWHFPPFELNIKDEKIFGRGIADMKGSMAAFLVALERHLKNSKHRIGLLITSAEEGDDYLDGTPYVLKQLAAQNIKIDACIVGEPTAIKNSGDMIKIGRRGSLSATGILTGQQGHVAYPHLANNAIHQILPFLTHLSQLELDTGNEYFDPSSLQITRVENFTKARNVIPGKVEFDLNIRFNTNHSHHSLQEQLFHIAKQFSLNIHWQWFESGSPFLTQSKKLIKICQESIKKICQFPASLSTSGGTSDARFIAQCKIPVVEIGLPNESIHQINENTSIKDLKQLADIYFEILQQHDRTSLYEI